MSITTEKRMVNSYFRLMKNWDNETKKDLIVKLTESNDNKTKDNCDFSSCFGAWSDDRSADEIAEEIHFDSVNTRF